MACLHCQKNPTLIDQVCGGCGFNQSTRRFSWIKVRLDRIRPGENMSIEDLIQRHAFVTQKAPSYSSISVNRR